MSERFLLRRDRVVQAGAGTGKTHALLTQYLHLCAGLSAHGTPLEPRALCALTFTDKAAGEMRERLQRRTSAIVRAVAAAASAAELPDALLAIKEEDLVQTAAALGRPLPGLALWEKVLAQLPGASIGTFHSFAASLLRRAAGLAGLDPDFTLLDEDSARALLVEASERVVLTALEGRLLDAEDGAGVTAEQAALVVSEYGFSGGPSAEGGAVEALCRLHRLRAEEGKDATGLAASYSAAGLDAERGAIGDALIAGLATLGRLGEQLGPSSAERVAELAALGDLLAAKLQEPGEAAVEAALLLCAELVQGLGRLRAKKDAPGAQEQLAQTKERLRSAVEELHALQASRHAAPLALALERLLVPVAAAYGAAKRAASALDFTDLLHKARDLLRDHPTVRSEAQARFAVLLVDEFQDTNPLQAELLELLAGPLSSLGSVAAAVPRAPGRLYIVGDRKQSIYEFRGADVAAYTELCDQLLALGAEQETLSRSYRSRPAVLHLVSALFAGVMQGEPAAPGEAAARSGSAGAHSESADARSGSAGAAARAGAAVAAPFFVRWDAQRDPLQAVRPADPLLQGPAVELVRAAVLPQPAAAADDIKEERRPTPPRDPSAENHSAPQARDLSAEGPPAKAADAAADGRTAIEREADLVAQRILALRDEGQRLGDIVVLLRRFTHLMRYTQALKRAGVAHYVVRGRGFYQAQEVLDVAALLTLLADPDDRLALLTLLRSPLCGLSDDSLLRLHQDGRLTLPALLQGRTGDVTSERERGRAILLPQLVGDRAHDAGNDRAYGAGSDLERGAPADFSKESLGGSLDDELGPPLELLGEARSVAPPSGLPADETARLERLLLLMQVLLRLGDRIGPAACLQLTYDHTDLLAVLAADPDGEQRVANLLRLQERARGFDKLGGLRAFVRALRLATDPQLKDALASPGDEPAAQIAGEADDVVRIMTVHQSKGLEFPVVLVAGCTTRERSDSPAVAYDRAVGLGLSIYQDGERVRTLAARRVDTNARLRGSAESARLFYVAATRARERLIFLGETSARPRLGGTWRAHLEALLTAQDEPRSADPGAAAPPLLAEWRPGPPPPPSAEPLPRNSEALLRAARQAAALVYRDEPVEPADRLDLVPSPSDFDGMSRTTPLPLAGEAGWGLGEHSLHPPSVLDLSPTPPPPQAGEGSAPSTHQNHWGEGLDGPAASPPRLAADAPLLPTAVAADLLVCARRFHLRTTARLFPSGPTARPALSEEAAGESAHAQLLHGSLAGQLLAQAEPGGGGEQLEALLLLAGLDPSEPRAVELQAHLQRFLLGQTRRGSTLGALLVPEPGTRVQRAVAYALTSAPGAARLCGVLDLVHCRDSAAGRVVTVIDYHYSSAPDREGPLHARRRALLALVAARLYPEATALHTGLCFLRAADAEPVLRPADPAARSEVAAELTRATPYTQLTLQSALRLPVLPQNTCSALGCEYQPLCHARRATQPSPSTLSDLAAPGSLH